MRPFASTVEDFVARFGERSERSLFIASKVATLAWGAFAVAFSFSVEAIAPTVLEAINKVGSMANGPLLALFCIAVFLPGLGQRAALGGFGLGLVSNLLIWQLLPQVSWLWWNVIGWAVGLTASIGLGVLFSPAQVEQTGNRLELPRSYAVMLIAMAALILGVALGLQR